MIAALVLAGALSGAVTGVTGGNGMSVMLSVLLLLGLPVHEVIGVCLAVQAVTMAAAFVPLVRSVGLDWELVPVICLPAVALSWVGARVALWMDADALVWVVAVALAAIGGLLLRAKGGPDQAVETGAIRHRSSQLAAISAAGGLSGFLAGLLGGGGNILVANALYKGLGVPFRRAVALSLCLGVVAAASGAGPYVLEGRVDPTVAPWMLVPALIVASTSGHWATTLPVAHVRRAQGLYLVAVAAILVARQVGRG
ncbi:MAG: sulfite exporter TauE/SafE family protein [Myxococcota bacterium]